jgi:putative ABC transport system permease protein
MSLRDAFAIAWRSIAESRMRSALTALGLIIGVSSVIVLIAVGQGTQKGVTDQIRGLGTNLIFIESSTQAGAGGGVGAAAQGTLTTSDVEGIAEAAIPGLTAVAPEANVDAQAIAGAENIAIEIVATTGAYLEVRDTPIAAGSFFSPLDEEEGEFVVVLGSRVAEALFPADDAVGQSARLAFAGGRISFDFRVVGVLAEQGGESDINDQVVVPLSALASRLRFLRTPTGDLRVTDIVVQVSPDADEERVKQQLTELLTFLHESTEPDFVVQSQDDLISAAAAVSNALSLLLGSVAGISLLVGGIGVMNIMLVSVTERTREIGIRRAVGATGDDIVKQFVAEALTLSLVGGLTGIALGLGVSLALDGRDLGGQVMTTVIQPWSIAVAFAVAAVVGLASGSYPAYKATLVDPIAALRNE